MLVFNTIFVEDRINSFLCTLKKTNTLNFEIHKRLFAQVFNMIYQRFIKNVPLIPNFLSTGALTYALNKYLVLVLSPITKNKYNLSKTLKLIEILLRYKNSNELFMVSLDTEKLKKSPLKKLLIFV